MIMGKISDALRGIPLDISQKQKVTALDKQFAEMESEVQRLKSQLLHLEAKVNPLEREVEGLKKQAQSGPLEFDSRTGTHIDRSNNVHYCTKCLSDDKQSPLKDELPMGWRCMVCRSWYHNPSAPTPSVITRPGSRKRGY